MHVCVLAARTPDAASLERVAVPSKTVSYADVIALTAKCPHASAIPDDVRKCVEDAKTLVDRVTRTLTNPTAPQAVRYVC